MLAPLVYSLRRLQRAKFSTCVALLSLAVGIGVSTAIVSIADAVLFRPLPLHEPSQLVMLAKRLREEPVRVDFGYLEYLSLKEGSSNAVDLAAYCNQAVDIKIDNTVTTVSSALVSVNYFRVLGVHMHAGRAFNESDYDGAAASAVVAYKFWQRQLNGNPNIVGTTLLLNGQRFTVIGVAPANFYGPQIAVEVQIWIPTAYWRGIKQLPAALRTTNQPEFDVLSSDGYAWLRLIGRRLERVTLEVARGSVTNAAASWERAHKIVPASTLVVSPIAARRIPEKYADSLPRLIRLFMIAAAGLLLIACANVAGLQVARAVAEAREYRIRLALGGSRFQAVRHHICEGVLLATGGGILGIVVCQWIFGLVDASRNRVPVPLPVDLALDWRFAVVAIAVTMVAVVVICSLAAMRLAFAMAALQGLRNENPTRSTRLGPGHYVNVAQVAVASLMLFGATLLVTTFYNIKSIPIGFASDGLVVLNVDLIRHGHSPQSAVDTYPRLLVLLDAIPTVESVCAVQYVPLGSTSSVWQYDEPRGPGITANRNSMSPGCFETLSIPVVSGRGFSVHDRAGAPPVAVVNEAYVRIMLKGDATLGQLIDGTRAVVGVIEDYKSDSLRPTQEPRYFTPFEQVPQPQMSLVVRPKGPRLDVRATVLRAARQIDPMIPESSVYFMKDQLDGLLWQPRFAALAGVSLACIASALAAIGMYGLLSFEVSHRTHDLALRRALGATDSQVLLTVLVKGASLGVAGLMIGLVASVTAAATLERLAYNVSPRAVSLWVVVSVVELAISIFASLIPALRAIGTDAAAALRHP